MKRQPIVILMVILIVLISSCAGITKKVNRGEGDKEEKEFVGLVGGIDDFRNRTISKDDKVIDLSSSKNLKETWMSHSFAVVPKATSALGEKGLLEIIDSLKKAGLNVVPWGKIVPVLREAEKVNYAKPEIFIHTRLWNLYNCQLTLFIDMKKQEDTLELSFDERSLEGSVHKTRNITFKSFNPEIISSQILQFLENDFDVVALWTGKVVTMSDDSILISGGKNIGIEAGNVLNIYKGIIPLRDEKGIITGFTKGEKVGNVIVSRVYGNKYSYVKPAEGVKVLPEDILKFKR